MRSSRSTSTRASGTGTPAPSGCTATPPARHWDARSTNYVSTDEPRDQIERMLGAEPATSTRPRRRRKDGTVVDVLLTVSPWTVDGLVVGVTGIALDLTERKANRARAGTDRRRRRIRHRRDRLDRPGWRCAPLERRRGAALRLPRRRSRRPEHPRADNRSRAGRRRWPRRCSPESESSRSSAQAQGRRGDRHSHDALSVDR